MLHLTYLGKLEWLRSFLGFRLFTPFARVTFGVFLLHFALQSYFYGTLGAGLYYEFFSNSLLAIGFAVFSYFFSFFVSMIYESPVVNILKNFVRGGE